jgi:hypothetical protein
MFPELDILWILIQDADDTAEATILKDFITICRTFRSDVANSP